MVKILDLEGDGLDVSDSPRECAADVVVTLGDGVRSESNASSPAAAALSCYPIASQLATYLDLNTLHELSRTCRQFRASLLEHRQVLIRYSRRCDNEKAVDLPPKKWINTTTIPSTSLYTKQGACARDMVRECQRCDAIVCRNCITKVRSSPVGLKHRLRRLCRTCMKAPLSSLTTTIRREDSEHDDMRCVAYFRHPCQCADMTYICEPCGNHMTTQDVQYLRGWAWRNRYSNCGGIGAGLGEGNEGVQCGRQSDCLAAKTVEKEIECEAGELSQPARHIANVQSIAREWAGSSYLVHETVGIGGKVKQKLTYLLPVGAAVEEYEEERAHGKFLEKEQAGQNRSWCSWCNRVVLETSCIDHSGAER